VAGLTVAGVLLRGAAAGRCAVVARDAGGYLDVAARLRAGELSSALAHHVPPGYPLLLVLAGGDLVLAAWLTALASGLVVPFAALAAGQRWGPRAAVWAATLAALWPLGIELGSELLSDGPFAAWVLGALACADRAQLRERGWPWGLAASLLAALGYFTRPEGLAVLGLVGLALALSGVWRRRPRLVAAVAAPALAALVPWLLWIRSRPVLGGSEAGAWKLTLKRNLGERLAILTPGLVAGRAGRLAVALGVALGPVGWLLAGWGLVGWARGRRRPRGPLLLFGAAGASLTLAYLLVRVDARYGLPLAALCLPWLGREARALARDPRWRTGLLVAALVVAAGATLRPRRADKAPLREAGACLREVGARRVLAHDSRSAFYAGAVAEHLLLHVPDKREHTPQRVIALARELRVDAVVWRVRDPDDSGALRGAFGEPVGTFGGEGQLRLEVYLARGAE